MNRHTINRSLHAIRMRMAQACEKHSYLSISGQIEIDTSFWRERRVNGKRRRGGYGQTIVFGFIKRQDKRCIRRSFQLALNPRCKRSFEARQSLRASSILMGLPAMMDWSISIMATMNLPGVIVIVTGSKGFGGWLKHVLPSFVA